MEAEKTNGFIVDFQNATRQNADSLNVATTPSWG
jgi:hypothetical protein